MAAPASDVRAVLSLPTTSPGPTAAQKRNAKRDARVQRELAVLIGPRGVPSLSVASGSRPTANIQRAGLKAKPRLGGGSVKWEQREFANGARKDGLKLRHWVKADSDPTAEYPFQKYDVPTAVYEYTDEEYDRLLKSDDWSKEETDYLFNMLREWDLRWFIVFDRWDFPAGPQRDLPDLQDRYCSICRRLIRDRPGEESTRQTLIAAYSFDHMRETERRRYLRSLANRTPEQVAEEEALFIQLKRLEQRERAVRKDRDGLLRTLMGVESGLPDIGADEEMASAVFPPSTGDRKRRRAEEGGAVPPTPMSASGSGNPASAAPGPVPEKRRISTKDDVRHCITRASPPPSANAAGLSIKAGGPHQPVYLRAFKLPVPKPAIAGKVVQALVELGVPMIGEATMLPEPAAPALGRAGDGVGEGAHPRSRQVLAALAGVLGVPSPESKRGRQLALRLVMPTRANCVKLERLLDSVALLVDIKGEVDRREQEIKVAQERLRMRREGIPFPEAGMEVDEPEGDSVSVAGDRQMSVSVSGTEVRGRGRKRRLTARSVSVSSTGTSATEAARRR